MAILSVGSRWTSATSGYVYDIQALTPRILYSPSKTYTPRIADSRIFERTPDDFLSRMLEGGSDFNVVLNGVPVASNNQVVTRTPN